MTQEYFCGIDVSKSSFSISVKNQKFVIENKEFGMNRQGFDALEEILYQYKGKILIGMEPTGIYHTNLFYFLKSKCYNSCIVNPYKMKQFFKFITDKPTKTDKKDAKAICQFVEFSKDNTNFVSEEEKYQVRYLVREKENLTHKIAKTKTEIKRILSVVFPEIETEVSVFGSGILSILYQFPSAAYIRETPETKFIKQAEKSFPDKGRKTKITPQQIYQLATNSIAHKFFVYEELLKMKIEMLNNLIRNLENIRNLISQIAEKIFKREIEILTSIPGVGRESAIYFISEIVDISRFENWKKLIGFCGLDPVIKQSGNYKGVFKISKRGNAHARRIAFIMGSCVKRSCSYFRNYYTKKRTEGKSYTEAVIATSTKLLRVIYSLLKENRLFV